MNAFHPGLYIDLKEIAAIRCEHNIVFVHLKGGAGPFDVYFAEDASAEGARKFAAELAEKIARL